MSIVQVVKINFNPVPNPEHPNRQQHNPVCQSKANNYCASCEQAWLLSRLDETLARAQGIMLL